MTPREWAALGLRLLAIFLFVQTVCYGGMAVVSACLIPFQDMGPEGRAPFYVMLSVAGAVPAVACWLFGRVYWSGAERLLENSTIENAPTGAFGNCGPLVAVGVAAWGAFNLVAAVINPFDICLTADIAGMTFAEYWAHPAAAPKFAGFAVYLIAAAICATQPMRIVSALSGWRRRRLQSSERMTPRL